MRKPLIVVTLAYAAGLLHGRGILYFPRTLVVLSLIALLALLISLFLRRLSVRQCLVVTLPLLAGALAYLASAVWTPADHYTRLLAEGDAQQHVLTGRIASALDRDPERTAFVLSLLKIDSSPASGRMRVSVRQEVSHLGYGDVVRFPGKLFEPRGFRNPGGSDYAAHLAEQGIARMVSLRDTARLDLLERGTGLFRLVQDWRERIRQAMLASLSGDGSAILQAMVLGEEGALTDEVRDRFMAAGVTHIISISGSHLGMLTLICFGLVRVLMRLLPDRRYLQLTLHTDPKKIAAFMTLPLVIFYTLLAGGQMATVRSLVMIAAAMAALVLDRASALLHALALAALCILAASPQALFDISFQLSFISVWTIGSVVLLWTELQARPTGALARAGQSALLLMIISLAAGLATGPLAAHYFNQVSFAGLIANMVVVPLAGMLVVPLGLLSGVLSLFLGHLPLAGLNQIVADGFLACVGFFADLPFAEYHPSSPGFVWLCCYVLFIGSAFVLLRSWLRFRFKPFESSSRAPRGPQVLLILSALALIVLTLRPLLPLAKAEVCFPDLGQGDGALIRLASGHTILIDGGGSHDDRFDVGRRVLAPVLWDKGITKLDLVVLSHPHPDHMNGLKFILQKFKVDELWTHGLDQDLPGYDELMRIARHSAVRHRIPRVTDPPLSLGQAEVRVLHPDASFRSREKKGYAAENDRSLVVRIAVDGRVLLFAGDIGTGAEGALLRAGRDVKCDVIKVPHHGSRSSSGPRFVQAARPTLAVFTVGRGNRYRHPAEQVVEEYARSGARMLRTDRDGEIRIDLDKGELATTGWSEREIVRIGIGGSAAAERENWKRIWVRKWEL